MGYSVDGQKSSSHQPRHKYFSSVLPWRRPYTAGCQLPADFYFNFYFFVRVGFFKWANPVSPSGVLRNSTPTLLSSGCRPVMRTQKGNEKMFKNKSKSFSLTHNPESQSGNPFVTDNFSSTHFFFSLSLYFLLIFFLSFSWWRWRGHSITLNFYSRNNEHLNVLFFLFFSFFHFGCCFVVD